MIINADLELCLINGDQSVSQAVQKLAVQPQEYQFLIVADENNKLQGTLTDGDIRRGLLRGLSLSNATKDFMNTSPIHATDRTSQEELKKTLLSVVSKTKFLPIVNSKRELWNVVFDNRSRESSRAALIMAGGFGKRLGARTTNTPKPLISVQGKPLLEHVLQKLEKAKIDRIFISTHFLSEQITQYIEKTGRMDKVSILFEERPMGTAGAIDLLPDNIPEKIIVTNSDILTNLNFRLFCNYCDFSTDDITMAVAEHKVYIPFGVVRHGPIGNFIGVDEKPIISNYVAAGIYCFPKNIRKFIQNNEKIDVPELIERAMSNGLNVGLFPLHEHWTDVGTPEDLDKAISAKE